jgi:hypothetical protein
VDNVLKSLRLVHVCGGKKLKSTCFDFMAKNFDEVRSTEEWPIFKNEHFGKAVMEEMLDHVCNYMLK